MANDYIANDETKKFMRKIGAIPDKKYPSSGTLQMNSDGSVTYWLKGVKKTIKKENLPRGVELTPREKALLTAFKAKEKNVK